MSEQAGRGVLRTPALRRTKCVITSALSPNTTIRTMSNVVSDEVLEVKSPEFRKRMNNFPEAPRVACCKCIQGEMWPYKRCKIQWGHRQTSWIHKCQDCGETAYVFYCIECGKTNDSLRAKEVSEGYQCTDPNCRATLPSNS